MATALVAAAIAGVVALALVKRPGFGFGAGVVVGVVMAAVTALMFVVWRRDAMADRYTPTRRVLGPIVSTLYVAWMGLFLWTFPRIRPSRMHAPVGAATLAFGSLSALVLAALLIRVVLTSPDAVGSGRSHDPADRVEIWHVRGKDLDYYVAHCACGWVGQSFGSETAGALPAAQADARRHGSNIDAAVTEIDA